MQRKTIFIAIILVVIFAVLLFMYFSGASKTKTENTNSVPANSTAVSSWKTYTADGEFSIKYPDTWTINPDLYEIVPEDNTLTIALVGETLDSGKVDAFQFVLTKYENPNAMSC